MPVAPPAERLAYCVSSIEKSSSPREQRSFFGMRVFAEESIYEVSAIALSYLRV
jgi:hypothetical protein